MIYLRNIAFYIAFYTGSVVFVSLAVLASYIHPRPLRVLCDSWGWWHRVCCAWLLGITVRETGTRPAGPALYALKHEAFFEAIDMPNLLEYPVGIAKKELFDIPGWGHAARKYGLIEVRREEGAKALRAMIRDVQPALQQRRAVAIFPEGTRVPHGKQPKLQSGFAALYKILRLPVVPVAINSGPLYQQKWKRKGTITVHFGDAIEPGLPREEIEARVHKAINCLNPGNDPA